MTNQSDAGASLLACPFCAHEAQVTEGTGPFFGRVQVECSACRIATFWLEEDVARHVWNRTRAEFEARLRIGYQHDNVRAHVNAENQFDLTEDQKQDIAARVECNYPPACPGCTAFDSGASEVNFVHGCEGCKARMQKIAGFGRLAASGDQS